MLLLYLYSILGMYLFAEVKVQAPLHDNVNFQDFGTAFLALIRASTGEAWHDIMYGTTRSFSITFQCIESPTWEDYRDAGFEKVGCGFE